MAIGRKMVRCIYGRMINGRVVAGGLGRWYNGGSLSESLGRMNGEEQVEEGGVECPQRIEVSLLEFIGFGKHRSNG
ncbi:hypothetical protein LINGRAHAP2_LOCUS28839 [Linum grandiflorum]